MKNVPMLIEAICDAFNNKEFAPKEGETYCNYAVNSVAKKMGCNNFEGLLANDMIDFMSASPDWSRIEVNVAQTLANQGSLVIATQQDSPHGHVCVVMPGNEKLSGKLGKVPMVMNVGKRVFIGLPVSYAFVDMPTFYAWKLSF